MLSCRITFYEFFLRISRIQAIYHNKIRLKNLKFEQVYSFIHAFCQRANIPDPQEVIETIAESNALLEIVKRSLLLVMVLDIIPKSGLPKKTLRSTAELYEEYTNGWLMTEATRAGVLLRRNEKHFLMKTIAWEMQKNPQGTNDQEPNFSVSISRNDLDKVLKDFLEQPLGNSYIQWPPFDLVDDIIQHSFLVPSKNSEEFYFSHKSFQEFYAAKHVFYVLKTNPPTVEQVLGEHLPVEIAGFLKEMLKSDKLKPREMNLIGENLEKTYSNNIQSTNILLREQACYYLASLGTPKSIKFLEKIYTNEPDKFVQRGILVGLSIQCKRQDIMDKYIRVLRQDHDADLINLGYHLIYYGDSPFENDYVDKGRPKCDGTIRAIVRHLRDVDYICGWVLDLFTLRRLIETRGKEILTGHDLLFVQNFLLENQNYQNTSFLQEKKLLETQL